MTTLMQGQDQENIWGPSLGGTPGNPTMATSNAMNNLAASSAAMINGRLNQPATLRSGQRGPIAQEQTLVETPWEGVKAGGMISGNVATLLNNKLRRNATKTLTTTYSNPNTQNQQMKQMGVQTSAAPMQPTQPAQSIGVQTPSIRLPYEQAPAYRFGTEEIPGDPATGDSKLIAARPGEAVVTKEAMDQPGMREFIAKVNAANPPRGLKKGAARDGYAAGTWNVSPDGTVNTGVPPKQFALPNPNASNVPVVQQQAVVPYQAAPQVEKIAGSGSIARPGFELPNVPAEKIGRLATLKNAGIAVFNHPMTTPVYEAARGTRDNLDGLEGDPALQSARALEFGGRVAAAGAGAAGGLAVGGPLAPATALVGGALGFMSPEAVNMATNAVSRAMGGDGTKLPSQIAAERRAAKQPKAFVGGKGATREEQAAIANMLNGQANYDEALAKFRAQEEVPVDKSRIYSQDFGAKQGVKKSTLKNGQTMYEGVGTPEILAREEARHARSLKSAQNEMLMRDAVMARFEDPQAIDRVMFREKEANDLEQARISAAPGMLQAEASIRAAGAKAKADAEKGAIEDFDKLVKESGYEGEEAVAFTDFFRNQYAGRKGADGKIIPGAEGMSMSERRAHMPQAKAMWEMVKQRNSNLTKGSKTNMAIERTKEDAMTLDDLTAARTKLGQALGLKKLYGEAPNEIGYLDYLGSKIEDAFLGNGADTMSRMIAPDGSTINVTRAANLKQAAGPYEVGDVKAHYKATQK